MSKAAQSIVVTMGEPAGIGALTPWTDLRSRGDWLLLW